LGVAIAYPAVLSLRAARLVLSDTSENHFADRKFKRGFGAMVREVIFCTGARRWRQRTFCTRLSPICAAVAS